MKKIETYASAWDAIADTPEQAANLCARAELMQQIAAIVKESGWTKKARTGTGLDLKRKPVITSSRILSGCALNSFVCPSM